MEHYATKIKTYKIYNMKQIITALLALFSVTLAQSQCISDFDFGDQAFGISPDFTSDESLSDGVVNEEYYDVIHMLIPQYAIEVDSTLPLPAEVELDSIELLGIVLTNIETNMSYSPNEIGLDVICNNNGDSNNECSFLGNNQYCASIEGTPTIAGQYDCTITINGWVTVLGFPFGQPADFEGITLFIGEGDNDYGCTDQNACNYSSIAIFDDGSCEYESCYGCTDVLANNYDSDAVYNDGSCCYLVIDSEANFPLCNGDLGTVNVFPIEISPEADLMYYLESGQSNNTGVFEVLAGIYTITAEMMTDSIDSDACSSTIDVIVAEPDFLYLTASATEASALGLGVGTASTTGGTGEVTIEWMDNQMNPVDPSALAAGTYQVSATDENGCTNYVTVEVIWNSIYEIFNSDISVYPNPTTNNITISFDGSEAIVDISILDSIGREVMRLNLLNLSSNPSISLSHLESGSYSMVITSNNKRVVKRIQLVK